MTRSREPKKHPGKACKSKMTDWRVLNRHSNYSHGKFMHSESSTLKCLKCAKNWRSKADYVALLKDATPKERLS